MRKAFPYHYVVIRIVFKPLRDRIITAGWIMLYMMIWFRITGKWFCAIQSSCGTQVVDTFSHDSPHVTQNWCRMILWCQAVMWTQMCHTWPHRGRSSLMRSPGTYKADIFQQYCVVIFDWPYSIKHERLREWRCSISTNSKSMTDIPLYICHIIPRCRYWCWGCSKCDGI